MATIRVQQAQFDITTELALLTAGNHGIGGVGSFIGLVRAEPGLAALTLEHYPGMTERALHQIAAAAEARWILHGCTIIHRIGRLEVGAPIVLVLVASPHRQEALDATRFLIDWLKTDAPFWKRAERQDGSNHWVEAKSSDTAARESWA